MPVTVTCTSVVKNPDGSFDVNWGGGVGHNYPSLEAMKDAALVVDTDPDTARRLLLAAWLRQDPDASDVNIPKGKSSTVDLRTQSAININIGI